MNRKLIISILILGTVAILVSLPLLIPVVKLGEIEVKGEGKVNNEKIISKIPCKSGDNFFTISKSRIKRSLLQDNCFADVKVSKKFPNKIIVEIVDHTPRYFLLTNKLWGITKTGIIVPLDGANKLPDLPVISVDTSIQVLPYQKATLECITLPLNYLNKICETSPEQLDEISEIKLDKNSLITYTYNDGIPILVNPQTPALNGEHLEIVLSRLEQEIPNILWIDLRSECLATVHFPDDRRRR